MKLKRLWLLMAIIFPFTDVFLTYLFTSRYGINYELNPIWRYAFSFGTIGYIISFICAFSYVLLAYYLTIFWSEKAYRILLLGGHDVIPQKFLEKKALIYSMMGITLIYLATIFSNLYALLTKSKII